MEEQLEKLERRHEEQGRRMSALEVWLKAAGLVLVIFGISGAWGAKLLSSARGELIAFQGDVGEVVEKAEIDIGNFAAKQKGDLAAWLEGPLAVTVADCLDADWVQPNDLSKCPAGKVMVGVRPGFKTPTQVRAWCCRVALGRTAGS